MDIVIIGTGNTASVLGKKLFNAGHRIVQVYGRDSNAASKLAYEVGTESTNYYNVITRSADLYLVAVSDSAVAEVADELQLTGQLVVHTAASVPLQVLEGRASHYGVFYPLQSLKQEVEQLPDIPIIIDASDKWTLDMLDVLAHTISSRVYAAGDQMRLKLHLAAVMVNNFTNHLFALVENYCKQEDLDFTLLLPLIQETAVRLNDLPAAKTQTGPAVRNDAVTINKHLDLLQKYPQLKKLYGLFTESIRQSR